MNIWILAAGAGVMLLYLILLRLTIISECAERIGRYMDVVTRNTEVAFQQQQAERIKRQAKSQEIETFIQVATDATLPISTYGNTLYGANVYLQATEKEDCDGFLRNWEMVLFFPTFGGPTMVLNREQFKGMFPSGILSGIPTDPGTIRAYADAANLAYPKFYKQWDANGNQVKRVKGAYTVVQVGTATPQPRPAPAQEIAAEEARRENGFQTQEEASRANGATAPPP